jgi:hypothetical protein
MKTLYAAVDEGCSAGCCVTVHLFNEIPEYVNWGKEDIEEWVLNADEAVFDMCEDGWNDTTGVKLDFGEYVKITIGD